MHFEKREKSIVLFVVLNLSERLNDKVSSFHFVKGIEPNSHSFVVFRSLSQLHTFDVPEFGTRLHRIVCNFHENHERVLQSQRVETIFRFKVHILGFLLFEFFTKFF